MKIDQGFHGPAVTININSRLGFNISVDFAVVIDKAASFRCEQDFDHGAGWPSTEKKAAIADIGVSFVARKDIHWLVSIIGDRKSVV